MHVTTFASRYACCLLALLLAAASPRALAHDFWISAHRTTDSPGAAVHMWVGHHLEAEEGRAYDAARTKRFDLLTPQGTRNLGFGARDGNRPYRRLAPELTPPALVVLDRKPVDISLDSAKFDSYLAEEHLDDILAKRRGAAKAGRERYTRHMKLLVGNDTSDLHARRLGQPLEIVLLDAPGKPGPAQRLRARVLFDGKPLAGRTVTIVSDPDARFDNHNARARTAVTDAEGTVSFDYDRAGFWLLRLVHMQPCTTDCGDADWRSWWAAFAMQPDWLPTPAMH